jgi:uncharacterized OB-fold protein
MSADTENESGIPALTRPVPVASELTQGFWDAVGRGALAVQRCAECRRFQHPPRATCRECGSTEVAFEDVSGRGRVWSWTTTRHGLASSFDGVLPYVCAIVELEEQEGLFLVTDFIGREEMIPSLRLGARAHVEMIASGGLTLPQFVVSADD